MNSNRIIYKPELNERGVYLALFAVFISAMMIALGVFGFDAVTKRRTGLALQKATDDLCATVTSNSLPMIQETSLKTFHLAVNNLTVSLAQPGPLNGVTITKADLIIPTTGHGPTRDFAHRFGGPSELLSGIYWILNGTHDTLGPCTNFGIAGDCHFYGDADWLKDNSADFPIGLWTGVENAGNTVGCQLEAKFDTLLSGEQNVQTKAVEYLPIRTIDSPAGASNGGLTIIVAPEMATTASDPRWDFRLLGTANFNTAYSKVDPTETPLGMFSSPKAPAFAGPSEARANAVDDWLLSPHSTNAGASTLGAIRPPRKHCVVSDRVKAASGQPVCDMDTPASCTTTDDAVCNQAVIELIRACVNPAQTVRNLFVSSIVELAARHGELRERIDLYIANPVTSDLYNIIGTGRDDYNSTHNWNQGISTRATALHLRGTSVFDFGAIFPLVSFRNSAEALSPWINPWRENQLRTQGTPIATERYYQQVQIANQMAHCSHLLGNRVSSMPRLSSSTVRPPLLGINYYFDEVMLARGFTDPTRLNGAMEPPGIQTRFASGFWGANDRTGWNALQGNPWQVNPPMGQGSFFPFTDVVAMLGTIQSCPSPTTTGCTSVGYNGSTAAADGSIALSRPDLEPDFMAALLAATAVNDADSLPFAPPGVFPFTDNTLTSTSPFGVAALVGADCSAPRTNGNAYRNCASDRSHILFVFHTPPSPEQGQVLSTKISNLRSAGHYITFAYFPVSRADVTPAALTSLYTALGIAGDPGDNNQGGLMSAPIVIFHPWSTPSGGQNPFNYGSGSGLPDWQNFSNYWHYMLDAQQNPNANIVEMAKKLFLHRIVKRKKIL